MDTHAKDNAILSLQQKKIELDMTYSNAIVHVQGIKNVLMNAKRSAGNAKTVIKTSAISLTKKQWIHADTK